MPEHINEFQKCFDKVEPYGGDISGNVLAYRFLKNANLIAKSS